MESTTRYTFTPRVGYSTSSGIDTGQIEDWESGVKKVIAKFPSRASAI